jgi:hypothetical protein
MNAVRKFRSLILVSSLALLTLGMHAAPAQAAYPFGNAYCRDNAVFGNTLHFYPTTPVYRKVYRTTYCFPTYNRCVTPVLYPVTLYDSFGRPYVVYQTSYTALVR